MRGEGNGHIGRNETQLSIVRGNGDRFHDVRRKENIAVDVTIVRSGEGCFGSKEHVPNQGHSEGIRPIMGDGQYMISLCESDQIGTVRVDNAAETVETLEQTQHADVIADLVIPVVLVVTS